MNTPRTFPLTLTALAAVTTLAALGACSTTPPANALLDQAHSDYRIAQDNPQARQVASVELKQAGDALTLADQAQARRDKPAEVDHLAYLAKQRVAIAQEVATQKSSELVVNSAEAERGKVQLAARTLEVSTAQKSAESSMRQADASQQQAANAQAHSADLEAQLKALNAKQTARGVVITIGDVLFDTGKSDLKAGGVVSVEKLAAFLKQYPQRTALIEGYTDSTGSELFNDELSEHRAEAVRAALIHAGVSGDRLAAKGYGEDFPAAGNSSAAGRQQNRRVEVVLSGDNGKVAPR